jgi:hypothetical protein
VYAQGIFTASPHQLLIKRNLGLGRRDFGEKWGEGFDQVEEAYCVVGSVYHVAMPLRRLSTEIRGSSHLQPDILARWLRVQLSRP